MPGILSRHARGICASPLLPNLCIFCCGNPSMRVWSLHPRYLDPQGLVALWRETLLAHKVLRGETRGYRHHPQLRRFQEQADPVASVDVYLQAVHAEAAARGYRFDPGKFDAAAQIARIRVT